MAFIGRSPPRILAAPSTAPQEAMAASLQAHIDELVQKNRAHEYTIRRLQQDLQEEKARGIEVVSRLRAVSQEEREEWQEGIDSLLASHRIVHLRTRAELDKERLQVLSEREESRRDRIAILHRDYRLTLFQAKETELEARVACLEDALEAIEEEKAQNEAAFMDAIVTLEGNLEKAETLRKDAFSKNKSKGSELASLQSEVERLRKEMTQSKSSSESSSIKLERVTLRLEGAKAVSSELEGANAELKRANADLKRQLDKWQTLETKGGAEIEEMRKRRIDLEVQVKELQGRVKDLEESEREAKKFSEKDQKKIAKLQKEISRLEEVSEEAQKIAEKAHDETNDAEKQLRAAHRMIEKLESEKLSWTKGSGDKQFLYENEIISTDVENTLSAVSEREVEKVLTPAKPRGRTKKAVPQKSISDTENSEGEQDEPQEEKPRKRINQTNGKKKGQETEVPVTEDEPPKRKQAGKSQARSKGSEGSRKRKHETSDSEPEQEEKPKSRKTKKPERGRKDPQDDSETESQSKAKSRKRKDMDSDGDEVTPKPRSKSSHKTKGSATSDSASIRPGGTKNRKPSSSQGESKVGGEEAVAKPKKKKLFPSSQAETFPWDSLPKNNGGLNIPTMLSPVKASDAVPARSMFGRVGSALGFR